MLCAISGEPPQVPVASRKTGTIFEKRLIEAYIAENGTDPVSGEDLAVEDLLPLKSDRTVHPRPPTQTSIPALLSTFQNEWDAIAVETFELKKQLAQTRQELSTALYDYEGALRLLARVMKERDDARAALARVQVGGPASQNGGAAGGSMDVDAVGLSSELLQTIEETQQKLSSSRRKRPVPKGWATSDNVRSFKSSPSAGFKSSSKLGSAAALAESPESEESSSRILYGAENGTALVYESDGNAPPYEISTGSRISDGLFWGSKAVFALASGAVKIYDGGNEFALFSVHAGPATGVTLHPSGDILASVGEDKSVVFYDLRSLDRKAAARIFTESELTCCQFHPDGNLLAAGGKDGKIRIINLASSEIAGELATDGPVVSVSFSENGYFLASASAGSTQVTNWDLRKETVANTIEFGQQVKTVAWDHSAQFLAAVGGGAVAVYGYQKKPKTFEELLKRAVAGAQRVAWDPQGQHLLVDGPKGVVELRQ